LNKVNRKEVKIETQRMKYQKQVRIERIGEEALNGYQKCNI
jgi:hypothetical protein